jgi:hypothetical protein
MSIRRGCRAARRTPAGFLGFKSETRRICALHRKRDTQAYLRLAEMSVGQLTQLGTWLLSDVRQTKKPIKATTVTTTLAKTLSLTIDRLTRF